MNNQEFDYIVIGAGSAGCVAVNRLSADPQNRVALVEAGASDRAFPLNMKTLLPIGNVLLLPDQRYNWNYEFTTDAATDNRTIGCPRGKLFGGCSSVNGTVYMRGHRADYDGWEAEGNRGWGYKEVLEAFKKHENWHDGVNPDYHGTGGELDAATLREPNPISIGFMEAAKQAGHPETKDFNGPEQDGFGLFALNQRGGARLNSSKAFLHPVLDRKNLTVFAETLVEKILIEDGRAVGLRIKRGGKIEELKVNKEIILSGGTINSPHLLMLSGIGPKKELAKHGIPVVKDLPGVGSNLQDHVTVSISNEDPSGYSFALTPKSFPRLAGQAAKYLLSRKGLLSSPVAEAGGFIRTQEGLDRPDVQVTFMVGMKTKANFVPTIHGTICHMNICRPKSRGRMSLRSASPYDKPIIEPGFLKDKEDVQILIRAIRIIREIFTKPAMAPYVGKEILPGREKTSDEDLEKFIRGHAATVYHPVGTCKMGPKSDKMAVVDNELRVHGIDGLRVADASIMPNIVSGNTSAPAMMIGERVAEFIQGKRNYVEQAA